MVYALLGNGFDLHHNLPTAYPDMIYFFDYWLKNREKQYDNWGDLYKDFLASMGEKSNKARLTAYFSANAEKLYNLGINQEDAEKILDILQRNCWFNCFNDSVKENSGWVDFEGDILKIIDIFEQLFSENAERLKKSEINVFSKFIDIKKLCILFPTIFNYREQTGKFTFKLTPKQFNYAEHFSYDFQEIRYRLFEELESFKKALRYYLYFLVDSILTTSMKSNSLSFLTEVGEIITLNYTNTFEALYYQNNSTKRVIHYHGNVPQDNIVLGIGSSKEDEVDGEARPNTDYIMFKKYHQRISYETDREFISGLLIAKIQEEKYKNSPFYNKENSLIIMGHSLDITDSEIITKLFQLCSKKITIYYHNDSAKQDYITNLVNIFGHAEVERMRIDQNLTFEKLQDY